MTPLSITTQPVASPHAHGGNSVGRTMLRVQFALLPATLYGFWLYGWPSFFLWLLTILSCVGFEALSLKLAGNVRIRRTLFDGSAVLTGWLLAMTLPPWAPWWVAVVGGFIAIVIGKQVFGGVGQNVFNPAMVARVALLVSFPLPLTQWVLAGGLYLLVTRVITWHAPLGVFLGVALPAAIAHGVDPARFLAPEAHLLSGALVLGAFFIATDYVTSPNTATGQLIFGIGVGFLTWVIRSFGGYPEGMAFAVLLMNALTPVIDRFVKPRVLGRDRKGRPLDIPENA